MSDAFTALAGIVALAAPVLAGPAGPYEARPALALHDTVEAGASRSLTVAYRDGEAITRVGVDKFTLRREDLPDNFVNALIAVEDSNFTRHMGVDPTGIGRAAFGVASGNDSGGGSTLTQQFVKNTLSGARRTYERKIEEAIAAVMTESISNKDEILESYANAVFFGRRAEGAEAAARNWFGREWKDLDLPQVAFLAGVLQAPSALDPLRSPERAKSRRDHVLGRMAQLGQVSEQELALAIAAPIDVIPPIPLPPATPSLSDSDFWAISDARRFLRGDNFINLAHEQDFRVTLDKQAQELGQAALDSMLADLNRITGEAPLGNVSGKLSEGRIGQAWNDARSFVGQMPEGSRRIIIMNEKPVGEPGIDSPSPTAETSAPRGARNGDVYLMLANGTIRGRPRVQGALVAIDVGTGEPIASVGGTASWASAFDRTRANRQPGSSIKPFLWLAALEAGFGPDSYVTNSPVTFQVGTEIWTPENYGEATYQDVPLYFALERSYNLVAARLGRDVGFPTFQRLLERANVYPPGTRNLLYPSSAIGAVETTPFRMAMGTAALDWRVSDLSQQGNLQDIERMMRGVVVRGTAARAFTGSTVPVAGKTGTSQSYRDAWFIGRTGDLAFAVWIGRDDDRPLPSLEGRRGTGGALSAPVAARFVREMHEAGLTQVALDLQPFSGFQPQPQVVSPLEMLEQQERYYPAERVQPRARWGSNNQDWEAVERRRQMEDNQGWIPPGRSQRFWGTN
jgi:penicillin-binding protein 1A